jgi:hypothetical protein
MRALQFEANYAKLTYPCKPCGSLHAERLRCSEDLLDKGKELVKVVRNQIGRDGVKPQTGRATLFRHHLCSSYLVCSDIAISSNIVSTVFFS